MCTPQYTPPVQSCTPQCRPHYPPGEFLLSLFLQYGVSRLLLFDLDLEVVQRLLESILVLKRVEHIYTLLPRSVQPSSRPAVQPSSRPSRDSDRFSKLPIFFWESTIVRWQQIATVLHSICCLM